ncbi:FAD-dependent oxidoreductase [Paenibacillus sp. FSL M8-0142]|uniref:NAD(P)/FAD-dependent oxidoreductase n=1 Tax=Paenibacillus sp. FSL M8-0142 TaxID=2954525 RepID=UPI003159FB0A
MILTGGTTPWTFLHNEPVAKYPRLEDKIHCDVLVIGGGISGAAMAYVLTKQGVDTVLLEKGRVCGGSTSANAGLLQFANDRMLSELIQQFNEQQGKAFYRMCKDAVNRLSDIAGELSIDSSFTERNSLYYASTPEDAGKLRHEYDILKRCGFDVEYWDRERIKAAFPFAKEAALYTRGDAEVNPYLLGHGMLKDASLQGLRIYEESEVLNCLYTDSSVVAHTQRGAVTAKQAVWAGGYAMQDWKPDRQVVLTNTYAIMTEPVSDLSSWHDQALLWESGKPYLYFRTTPDHRIMAGGLDEPPPSSGRPDQFIKERSARLLKEIGRMFPKLEGVRMACAWAGIFASTKDGMPLIGCHPEYPNSYFMEVYGGNGTVFSMIAAELLAEAIAGREPEALAWLSLTRPVEIKNE